MAIFMVGSGEATVWFALPLFRAGEFGGVFTLGIGEVPPADAGAKPFANGRLWLVNLGSSTLNDARQPGDYPLEAGVKALYMVCVHLGCRYKWVATNDRFESPCHGSKYLRSSVRIDGPANRNLDVFVVEVLDGDGNVLTRSEPAWDGGREGTAVQIPADAAALRVDTGRIIRGAPNTKPGGGL